MMRIYNRELFYKPGNAFCSTAGIALATIVNGLIHFTPSADEE